MILIDVAAGIAALAEEHGWFTSNISFGTRKEPVATISMDRKRSGKKEEDLKILINTQTIAAVVRVGGVIVATFHTSIEDEFTEDLKRFLTQCHYEAHEALKDLVGDPHEEIRKLIPPKQPQPWPVPWQPYQQPYIGDGTGGTGPTWIGGSGTISISDPNSGTISISDPNSGTISISDPTSTTNNSTDANANVTWSYYNPTNNVSWTADCNPKLESEPLRATTRLAICSADAKVLARTKAA